METKRKGSWWEWAVPTRGITALMRWFDSTDLSRDAKIAAFLAVIAAEILWMSRDLAAHGITASWVDNSKWLLIATSLGGAVWSGVDVWRSKNNAAAQQSAGSENEEAGR